MISEDTVIRDDLDDDVSAILQAMSDDETWTSKKSALREELVSLLKKRRYLSFVGSPCKYYAHRVGDSYLYDVPLYKQGWLKRFRGKRVRIVCVGSGRYKQLVSEKKRKVHSPEFKAKVGLEALKGLKTINEIGQEYGVHYKYPRKSIRSLTKKQGSAVQLQMRRHRQLKLN
jgi:hypothetical protein